MQTWLAAIDDLPEIVSHGTVLIVLTSQLCRALPLIAGRLIDTTISHGVNSMVRDIVGWLLLLTLGFSTVQEVRARYGGFVRPISWPVLDRPRGSTSSMRNGFSSASA